MVAFSVVNRVTHNIRGYDVSLSVRSKVCLNDVHALPLDRGGSAVLEDEFLTMASYHAVERTNREHCMHSLSAGVTQSWFVAKAAVALVLIVIFGAADVIGWFLRRTIWRRKTMAPRLERARDDWRFS